MKIKYQYTLLCGILMLLAIYLSVSTINVDYNYMVKYYNGLIEKQNYNHQLQNTKININNATAIFKYFINEKGLALCSEREQNDEFIELTRRLELLRPASYIQGPWVCEAQPPYKIVYYPNKPEYTGMSLNSLFRDASTTNETALTNAIEDILTKFGKGKIDLSIAQSFDYKQQKQLVYIDALEECNFIIGANCILNDDAGIKNKSNWFALKNKLNVNFALAIGFIFTLLGATVIYFGVQRLSKVLDNISAQIKMLTQGKFTEKRSLVQNNETADIINNINNLRLKLIDYNNFMIDIKKGNINSDLKTINDSDTLYNNLVEVRNSIIRSKQEVNKQKIEDRKRQWSAEGMAQFIDLFSREENNLNKLAEQIISNLVSYLEANQGALYILSKNIKGDEEFEMYSCFAYNRKKIAQQKIAFDDGLFGRIYHEHKTILLNEVPENYLYITSGLGDSPPKYIILTPLIYEKQLQGVIEIASFKQLEQHKIEFIEKVCENIASAISMRKISLRTNLLLEESQNQKEELSRHEKILRNNMERMKKSQNKAKKKEQKLQEIENAINKIFIRFVVDLSGAFISINDKLMELLNYNEQDLIGKKIAILLSEKENKLLLNTLSTLNNEGDDEHHEIVLNMAGRRNSVQVTLNIVAVINQEKNVKTFLFIGK